MVIGSILPASVLNAFRRGSLVSSSQQSVPRSNGEKKANKKKKSPGENISNRIANKQETQIEKLDGSVQRENRHTDQLV